MTEQSSAVATGGYEENPTGDRRAKLLAGVAGALVLAVAAYFLLFAGGGGGSQESTDAFTPRVHKPGAAAVKPAAAPVVKTGAVKKAPAIVDVTSRDPFRPEVAPPPPAPSTTDPSAPTGTTPPGTTPTGTTPTGTAPAASVQTIKLVAVTSATQVKVSVDGTTYVVSTGKDFATYYRLLDVQGTKCATFLYGDKAFDLCQGHTFIHSA